MAPKGWPLNIAYLDTPVLSKLLSQEQRDAIFVASTTASSAQSLAKVGNGGKTRIVAIDDRAHPAHGQKGLFAAEHLEPDTFILPYIGFVHCDKDVDETSDYDISLDRDLGLGIDAAKRGNEARFVNDYRGIPARKDKGANAEFRECWILTKEGRAKVMGIYVLSAGKSQKRAGGIAKGEEIVVSYGKGFWRGRESE